MANRMSFDINRLDQFNRRFGGYSATRSGEMKPKPKPKSQGFLSNFLNTARRLYNRFRNK